VEIFQTFASTSFGPVAMVWTKEGKMPKVRRIYLPSERKPVQALVETHFGRVRTLSCEIMEEMAEKVESFFLGRDIVFNLGSIRLDVISPFQKRVLLAEFKVPRGWVTTYGRIAAALGNPRGARSVGTALARNPFPIIIPCHRAVRSDGMPGGFQGGMKMKRALLELEGVEFSPEGKVLTERLYY